MGWKYRLLLFLYYFHCTFSTQTISKHPCTRKRRATLSWINGIGYRSETAARERQVLTQIFGILVHHWYNPSSMTHDDDLLGFARDLATAGTHKMGFGSNVQGLVQHLRFLLDASETVVHICHSHGVLLTALALQQMQADELLRLDVICLGGADTLDAFRLRRCIHYYSINDPLLYVVPRATQALRSGFLDSFCFLAPRTGDPVKDHYLLEPTYRQALEWEAKRFQKTYRMWMDPLLDAHDHVLQFVKYLIRPIVLWCLLLYELTLSAIHRLRDAVLSRQVKPVDQILDEIDEASHLKSSDITKSKVAS